MSQLKFSNYEQFWKYYLSEHSHPRTRFWHAVGGLVGLGLATVCAITGNWFGIILALAVGYAFAWYSHFFIERNRPATWNYPLWSFISEFRMLAWILTGKLSTRQTSRA